MSHTKEQLLLAVGTTLMIGGCSNTDPASPADATTPDPQYSFINAPSTPNVYRTAEGFVFGLPDEKSGLIAWAGLPATPSEAIECGGTEDFDLTPLQAAGWLQAFNLLALKPDMHIHVYDIATFTGTCDATPIAAGTGRFIYSDNDWLGTGTGANSFGPRIQGTLTMLATGATVRVIGETHAVRLPNGSFRFTSVHVSLHPVASE